MNDSRLGGIICCLQLRDIDNMPTHTGRSYKATLSERRVQRLAIDIRLLLLLSSPVRTCHSGTIECTIQIGVHNFVIMVHLAEDGSTLCPWYSRVGNENIETAVEIADVSFDGSSDGLDRGHVDLVGLACGDFPSVYALQ